MIKVIKKLTGREGVFHRLSPWIAVAVEKYGGWLVHNNDKRLLYFYDHNKLFRVDINHPLGDLDVVPPEEDIQAIKNWELKQQLTPNAQKTFSELIDVL